MSVETNEINLNPETKIKLQELQKEKDLEWIITLYENLPEQEQNEFLRELEERDPIFKEMMDELKTYFNSQLSKLEQEDNTTNEIPLNNSETTQETPTLLIWETTSRYLDQNKDFKAFLDFFDEKEINWKKEVVLNPQVYEWIIRYDSNKEPLAKALWQKEIWEAKKELQQKLDYMRTWMIHAPENLDASQGYAREQFKQKEQEIIKKYLPVADDFVKLIKNTDIWKKILENTIKETFQSNLKENINRNISNDSWKETPLWNEIENKTNRLFARLSEIQSKLQSEIQTYKETQENLKQRDYITRERILYQDIPNKYEREIKQELKDYAFDIWKDLIQNNVQVFQEKKEFNLPLWTWNDIILDFSELWDIEWKSEDEILKQYEKSFDDIYKDTLTEKILDELTSKKWIIDIVWIVISWLVAVKYSVDTMWLWIPTSAIIFTASENLYRAAAYEIFDIEWWALEWLWISENDTSQDIIRKKLFELASNWVLFSLFKVTWLWEKALTSMFKDKTFMEDLSYKIASYWIKTWAEAWFFTYYTIASNNLQERLQNSPNTQEVLDSFTRVGNMQDFMKLFSYNIWFVTLVKWWWALAEKQIVARYEKQINEELERLKANWIFYVDWVFYRRSNVLTQLPKEEFWRFIKLNQDLWKFSTESYRKPESWRAWKMMHTNYPDPAKRYENLEKYSRETREWWIKQALWDKTIWQTLESNWLNSWKWVWEWLLRKSWFNNDEVNAFKRWELKWEKPKEVSALAEMDRAMEVVYREYKEGVSWLKKWLSMKEAFPNLGEDLYSKLRNIIDKDTIIEKPKKRERL